MKTRAKDKIKLSNGRVLTLAEALERGDVVFETFEDYTRKTDVPRKVIHYVAREKNGDLYWDVNETYYRGGYKNKAEPAVKKADTRSRSDYDAWHRVKEWAKKRMYEDGELHLSSLREKCLAESIRDTRDQASLISTLVDETRWQLDGDLLTE